MTDFRICAAALVGVLAGALIGQAVRPRRVEIERVVERTGGPMRVPSERVRTLAAQVRAEADERAGVVTPAWIVQLAGRDPNWRRRSGS